MFLNTAALFLWLGTSIAAVSAVDTRPPSFNLAVRNHYNHAELYHRAVANYDNGLYDRDLADLGERDVDDFIKRASLDKQVYQVDKRLFDDGNEIDRRGELKAIVKGIVKLGRKIVKGVKRIKEAIKKSHERKKDHGNSNSTLFRRADDNGLYGRDLADSGERELGNEGQQKERGQYTSTLVAQLCVARPEYNWLIIHDGNVHWDGERGKDWGYKQVELPLRVLHKTESYDVYYGKNGTAERKGAGGSLNWAFCGKFKRDNDRYVTFFRP